MTMRRDPLLDDDERKLAEQLARIAPHGEPSADLDARILAMAERGLAGAVPATARRRPRRWPVWLGAAASLTVVAGLVWQLQPVLEPRHTIRYEAPASVAADNDANGKRQPIDYVEPAASDAAMPPPPPPVTEPVAAQPTPTARRASRAEEAVAINEPVAPPAPPPPPAPITADAAAQADAAAAKTLAADRAMAQEAPRRPAPVTAEASANPPAAPATVAVRIRPPNAAATQAEEVLVIEPAPPDEDRAGFDARPPLTADTPDVQRNWLARIRELRDAGNLDGARQSLAAFVKRNPTAEIPADLKPLLPPKSSPSTEP